MSVTTVPLLEKAEMPRYRIEQTDGGCIIVNTSDEAWAWCGGYWIDREQRGGAHLTTFADRSAAEVYAREVLGE